MFNFIINMSAIVIIGLFMIVDLIGKILLILLSILKTTLQNAVKKKRTWILLLAILLLASCSRTIPEIQIVVKEQLQTNSKINRYINIEISRNEILRFEMKDIFWTIENINGYESLKVVNVIETTNNLVIFTLDRYSEAPSSTHSTVVVPIFLRH